MKSDVGMWGGLTNVNIRVDHGCIDYTPLSNEDMISNLICNEVAECRCF